MYELYLPPSLFSSIFHVIFVLFKVVTKTFHGAGLVVPVDKNDVGYRELPETDGRVFMWS